MKLTSSSDEYDPYEHAERLGLTIEHQQLRTGYGLYIPQSSLILLRPRMKVATERSVLAHEIQHHLQAHRRVTGLWSVRQERAADRGAALELILPHRLEEVQSWSSDPREWAIELGVTGDILLAYLRTKGAA